MMNFLTTPLQRRRRNVISPDAWFSTRLITVLPSDGATVDFKPGDLRPVR